MNRIFTKLTQMMVCLSLALLAQKTQALGGESTSRSGSTPPAAGAPGEFAFELKSDRLVITASGKPVADYVFKDDKILRPYFANVHAPGGVQVTRDHPPVEGRDATDHPTMHPGIWLAFGDINGQDFWRNKAAVRHERFVEAPTLAKGGLTFTTLNRLLTTEGKEICSQTSRVTWQFRPDRYLLIWEATFESRDGEIIFGDQEEMGLGVRVATFITEKNGGNIVGSTGQKTARETWGKTAEWCDYSAKTNGRIFGAMIMPGPTNFRPSWFHNRDYGLMVANPFGRNAFKQGEPSRFVVKPNTPFRLRFGVLLHSSPQELPTDLKAAYADFLKNL